MPTVVADVFRNIRRALGRFELHRHVEAGRVTSDFGQLHIIVEKDELDGGWVASCPDLPGCYSQGETEDEAVRNITDAIVAVISTKLEDAVEAASHATREHRRERTIAVAL